jgi:hypothetical protein
MARSLLKSLEVVGRGFNYRFASDFSKLYDVEFLAGYEKEQAERAAQLIGENYDRFEHLTLDFPPWDYDIESCIMNYLKNIIPMFACLNVNK